jgi:hypothetical protein
VKHQLHRKVATDLHIGAVQPRYGITGAFGGGGQSSPARNPEISLEEEYRSIRRSKQYSVSLKSYLDSAQQKERSRIATF